MNGYSYMLEKNNLRCNSGGS